MPERQSKIMGLSCRKALMPHCDHQCAHRTKDHTLVNTKGEQAICLLWLSIEAERQVCNSQRWKTRCCRNLSPRDCIFSQAMKGLLLLTMSFWDLGQFISTENVTDQDQLPWGDTRPMWDCALMAHLGAWEVHNALGSGNSYVVQLLPGLHTCASSICCVPPSPQHNWASTSK